MTTAAPEQFEALLALQSRDSRAATLRERLTVLQKEPELVESLKRQRAAVAKAKELQARGAELEGARDAAHQKVEDLLGRSRRGGPGAMPADPPSRSRPRPGRSNR